MIENYQEKTEEPNKKRKKLVEWGGGGHLRPCLVYRGLSLNYFYASFF